MNKNLKIEVLKALKELLISKEDAKTLLKSEGNIIIDLSSKKTSGTEKAINPILEKAPKLKSHFVNIISLGNGSR